MATGLRIVRQLKWMAMCAAVVFVAACGGGGDDGDSVCVDNPNRDPRLPTCEVPVTPPGTTQSSISLVLVDSSGNAVNAVAPTAPVFAEARVVDTAGRAAPNMVVAFATTDATGGFNPPSGTVLTDASGIAKTMILAGSTVGAFTVTASTSGNATGTVTESGKAGVVLAGSAIANYAVNTANLPATAVGSIKFVSATPPGIALKGTGGVGRQEFSTVTFQVFDQTGHALPARQVNFALNTSVGGLSLQPATAFTGVDGKVATVVSAGTMPTPIVVVSASVPGSGITTVSNVLTVSTGLPVDARTSLSIETGNIEGWNYDGICTGVTLRMADHFGNPAPDGTVASFTSSHGIVDASCRIDAGGACGMRHCSAGNRPPMGRAVVLGYTRGEEDFFDANGNNVCDGCGNTLGPEFKAGNDLKPDVFRDDNENGRWSPNEPCIGPNTNGGCGTAPDGIYNGVLADPGIPGVQQTTYLGRSYVAIWSGSYAYIAATPGSDCAGFSPPGTGTSSLHFRIVDVNGNPMPAGTSIAFIGDSIVSGAKTSFTVANYLPGLSQTFVGQPILNGRIDQIQIDEYDIPVKCSASGGGPVTITVTTPRGIVTTLTVPIPK